MRILSLAAAALLALCGASAGAADREPDVIYVPTPQGVVEDMLRLADVSKGDVLYDLGSGDGRIPVTAARKTPGSLGPTMPPKCGSFLSSGWRRRRGYTSASRTSTLRSCSLGWIFTDGPYHRRKDRAVRAAVSCRHQVG